MASSVIKIGEWELCKSKRTGAEYYTRRGESLWRDATLPPGWAWRQLHSASTAPREFVNLFSGVVQLTIPTMEAVCEVEEAVTTRKRARSSDGGAGGADGDGDAAVVDGGGGSGSASGTAIGSDANVDDLVDEPLLALARQEWLAWHHRKFALAVGTHWPFGGGVKISKSVRAMIADGLLAGTQGSHARFLFGQMQSQSRDARVDALLPSVPGVHDKDTSKEFSSWGIAVEAAEASSLALANAMAKGAAAVAFLRRELARTPSPTHSALVRILLHRSGGTLVDVPAAFLGSAGRAAGARAPPGTSAILIFDPPAVDVAKWLAPVRAAATLTVGCGLVWGTQNFPLYGAASASDTAAALAAASIVPGPFTAVLTLNASHLNKLCALAERASSSAPNLLRALFCVVARYETFSGNTGGIQGAMPHHVFDALEASLGVTAECFASPLNAHFPSFCSAFPDTDRHFGSQGSFFDWTPLRGAFQANPPFINATMLAMAQRMDVLLGAATAAREPLLFFIVVPAWVDSYYHKLLVESPFHRAGGTLAAKAHEYIDGLQWRVARTVWGANVDTTWVLLATDAVALPPLVETRIIDAFAARVQEKNSKPRVFQFDVD